MVGQSVDLLVVGGGVMGLWVARRAVQAGMSTMLASEHPIGSHGGSANPLGALMPHAPDRWGPLAEFQFQALMDLEVEAGRLAAETGLEVGYARLGRITPLATEQAVIEAKAQAAAAEDRWRAGDKRFHMEVRSLERGDLISSAAAPEGVRADDLTARISPRLYLAALKASIARQATILEGVKIVNWDGAAVCADGRRISAGAIVAAAGAESFPLLQTLSGGECDEAAPQFGRGVKGQAAIFEPEQKTAQLLARAPLLYSGGLYVAGGADGRVCVGSTTETEYRHADRPDAQAASLAAAAQKLCPLLEGAAPTRFWAGLRPRTASRHPAVGRFHLRDDAPIWVATGGYKISFGVAHRIAAALIERILGGAALVDVPESFDPAVALHPRKRSRAPSQ